MDKRGVQLALNTLVVIILSITILALGAVFLFSFAGETESLSAELDSQTNQQIESLLTQGQKVAIPLNTKATEPGGQAVFGYGIINVLPQGAEFTRQISFSKAIDVQNNEISVNANDWVRFSNDPIQLANQDSFSDSILVVVPKDAAKGTYIYNLEIFHDGGRRYDSVKKFYVTVE